MFRKKVQKLKKKFKKQKKLQKSSSHASLQKNGRKWGCAVRYICTYTIHDIGGV
jgi:hypothetical protein